MNNLEVRTFLGLSEVHKYQVGDIYFFACKVRDVKIAKGNFRFAPIMYLKTALEHIDTMLQKSFEEIVENMSNERRSSIP